MRPTTARTNRGYHRPSLSRTHGARTNREIIQAINVPHHGAPSHQLSIINHLSEFIPHPDAFIPHPDASTLIPSPPLPRFAS
jgi:hypothetical protein